ncbi:MAG: 4'-phosphopantetheinyl transferase superfamily protein [Flavobacteriaceae bacterium]|jgi:phosphopantetheinyl transferase|nr:4'-phosphopantetheinyl transferase superfamily protein [Flavobacteriaceae bacterium]
MPLYKTITVNAATKVLIWKIEESFDALLKNIELTTENTDRLNKMKSVLHQKGFLSIRHLLAIEGYTDYDLFYDANGKPHLTDGVHVSITHSFIFSAIILSDIKVGIDVEKKRDKILRIAHKFNAVKELSKLSLTSRIRKLTAIWCAKESLYKGFNSAGLSFLNHIHIEDFGLDQNETTAIVDFNNKTESYHIWFSEFEGFTCAYALINNKN